MSVFVAHLNPLLLFRYYEIYSDLDWEVDFFKQRAAVAPYGGPVGKIIVGSWEGGRGL